jgi:hypothetical protein
LLDKTVTDDFLTARRLYEDRKKKVAYTANFESRGDQKRLMSLSLNPTQMFCSLLSWIIVALFRRKNLCFIF